VTDILLCSFIISVANSGSLWWVGHDIVPWVGETKNTYTVLVGDLLETCYITRSKRKGELLVL
jgi:hypothetical protein